MFGISHLFSNDADHFMFHNWNIGIDYYFSKFSFQDHNLKLTLKDKSISLYFALQGHESLIFPKTISH